MSCNIKRIKLSPRTCTNYLSAFKKWGQNFVISRNKQIVSDYTEMSKYNLTNDELISSGRNTFN